MQSTKSASDWNSDHRGCSVSQTCLPSARTQSISSFCRHGCNHEIAFNLKLCHTGKYGKKFFLWLDPTINIWKYEWGVYPRRTLLISAAAPKLGQFLETFFTAITTASVSTYSEISEVPSPRGQGLISSFQTPSTRFQNRDSSTANRPVIVNGTVREVHEIIIYMYGAFHAPKTSKN